MSALSEKTMISPLQFETTPQPLLVRKETVVIPVNYDISYDHKSDCITIVKTETFIKQTTTQRPSTLPRWKTVKEQYLTEVKDKRVETEISRVETDEGVYEEVSQISSQKEDKEEKEDKEGPKQEKCSVTSLDSLSSLLSILTITVTDYLTWINVCKVMVIAFCLNGLLLQIIVLSSDYFSDRQTLIDLSFGPQLSPTSVTLCFALIEGHNQEEMLVDSNSTKKSFKAMKKRFNSSHIFDPKGEKFFCFLRKSDERRADLCEIPVQSVDNNHKCLTFGSEFGRKGDKLSLLLNWTQYHVHNNVSNNGFLLSIHSSKMRPKSDQFIKLFDNRLHAIKFHSFSLKRLSSARNTCHDYTDSRDEHVHTCIVGLLKEVCACIPRASVLFENDFNDKEFDWCQNTCSEEYASILIGCNHRFPQDCEQHIYSFATEWTRRSTSSVGVEISVQNRFQTNGDLVLSEKPVLTVELYMSSVGGLVVVWALILVITFSVIYLFREIYKHFVSK